MSEEFYQKVAEILPKDFTHPALRIELPKGAVIFETEENTFLVTKNFFDEIPMWREYKRLGWALRHLGLQRKNLSVVSVSL